MRVRYLVRLREPVLLEDHWPISIMGGAFRVVSTDGKTVAFEITFIHQSVDLAPKFQQIQEGKIKASIVQRDTLLPLVRTHLDKAFSYLQCFFNIAILIDEIEVKYEGETLEEEEQIDVKGMSVGKDKRPLPITYDFFTRAIMAAETGQAPEFEATLVSAARNAMLQNKYIDSFRYSFLLIESLYGDGKFKTAQLKDALNGSAELRSMCVTALKERMAPKRPHNSDTEILLAAQPAVDSVIDHLVEKRGFYFHGNIKRKDAWRPYEQEEAEALCLLSLEISTLISQAAAAPMFDDKFAQRHFENAKSVGAIMTMNVKFLFREPSENIDRNSSMNISVPGTKVTPKMALHVVQKFLENFEHGAPVASLKSATCTVKETGQKVFEIAIHVGASSDIGEDAKS